MPESGIVLSAAAEWSLMLRVVVAGMCGAAIGYERNKRKKEAGIRTHIVVALGAALVMIVSKYGFFDLIDVYDGLTVDASRVAANVVSGISFLGAGVIFLRDLSIKGLTTAAGIWTTAGVGLAIGAGLYIVGVATAALVIGIQVLMHKYLTHLEAPIYETISVTYQNMPDGLERIKQELSARKIFIDTLSVAKEEDGSITLTMEVAHRKGVNCNDMADLFLHNPDVRRFHL